VSPTRSRLIFGRRPLVAASLTDAARLLEDARLAVKAGADVLEIRADCFPSSLLKTEPLRDLIKSLRSAVKKPLLLTVRCRAEGGRLPRAVDEQDRLSLIRGSLSEVDAVDVEMSDEEVTPHVLSEARKRRRRIILSFHDFKKTPSDETLSRLVKKFRRLRGDVLKIAAMPKRKGDVDRLMKFCQSLKGPRVFISMGPLGRASRLDGVRWGSLMTYGFVRQAAAPGQFPVSVLSRHRAKAAPSSQA
jgi:3-dehydroquinate dehydratase I